MQKCPGQRHKNHQGSLLPQPSNSFPICLSANCFWYDNDLFHFLPSFGAIRTRMLYRDCISIHKVRRDIRCPFLKGGWLSSNIITEKWLGPITRLGRLNSSLLRWSE